MPVVTAGSESLPPLYGHICEQQWYCDRRVGSVLIITVILAIFFFGLHIGRQQPPKRQIRVEPNGKDITWTLRAPSSSINSNFSPVLDYWVRLKQGQGRFEKWASRAVSRGGASGTVLVRLGGSRGRREMEEEKRISDGSKSREVSIHLSDGAGVTGGLPSPEPLLATAERSDHVGTSPEDDLRALQQEENNMEDARYGGSIGGSSGAGLGAIQEARGRISTSFLAAHMADDEHIIYGAKQPLYPHASAYGQSSPSHRQFGLDFARSSPTPSTPPASTAGLPASLTAHIEHSQSIAISSRVTAGGRPSRESSGEALDRKDGAMYHPEDGASPSSYPPTSPLLPPPPPTAHEAFDPAAVMFPGPARDGGIRIVPPHNHSEAGPSSAYGEVASGSDSPQASWTRHTRVYGGGVCLACAAAASGEGGFYGDSVRPEDKR